MAWLGVEPPDGSVCGLEKHLYPSQVSVPYLSSQKVGVGGAGHVCVLSLCLSLISVCAYVLSFLYLVSLYMCVCVCTLVCLVFVCVHAHVCTQAQS